MPPRNIRGTLNYRSPQTVDLITEKGSFLLIRDVPPLGHFDIEDIAAAAEFMVQMGKNDGDSVEILAFEHVLPSGHTALLISRFVA